MTPFSYHAHLLSAPCINKELVVIHEDSKGNDPLSLVNAAEEEFLKELKRDTEKNGFDHVFVVFDKDTHVSYNDAIQKTKALSRKHKEKFRAIVSIPCFEFWLLLHFEDATRPYAASGSNSICDNVLCDLKVHIPAYGKGNCGVFEITYSTVETAIARAQLLEKRHEGAGSDNPSTKVHQLVEYLRGLIK